MCCGTLTASGVAAPFNSIDGDCSMSPLTGHSSLSLGARQDDRIRGGTEYRSSTQDWRMLLHAISMLNTRIRAV